MLHNKAVYIIRTSAEGVGEVSFETDIVIGEVPVRALNAFRALLADLYMPLLVEQEQELPGHSTSFQTQETLKVQISNTSSRGFTKQCLEDSLCQHHCSLMTSTLLHQTFMQVKVEVNNTRLASRTPLQAVAKFTGDLSQVAANTQGMPGLQSPDQALLDGIDGKPGSFGKSAANGAVVLHCSIMLTSWCTSIRAALAHKRISVIEVSMTL